MPSRDHVLDCEASNTELNALATRPGSNLFG
jgi:hypothetical protein